MGNRISKTDKPSSDKPSVERIKPTSTTHNDTEESKEDNISTLIQDTEQKANKTSNTYNDTIKYAAELQNFATKFKQFYATLC